MYLRTNECLLIAALAASLSGTGVTYAADHLVPQQFPTIQSAIDAALPGDTVIVSDGVYSGAGNRDISFDGKAITVRSLSGPGSTTIEAGGTPQNPFRGFAFTNGETNDAILDGFTITGGATLPGAIADQFNGGGILVNNGSNPTIRNCVVKGNTCGCWGAGICVTNASPVIINCEVSGNNADDDGGGIFAWGTSSPVIVNSVIRGNSAPGTGGGVTFFTVNGTIINSTIVANEAGFGAGVYAWGTTIINSIVWGNDGIQINVNNNNSTVIHSNIEGGFPGEGNKDVDPMFVDAAAGDLHLSPDSPLIGAGANAYLPEGISTDMDGDARIVAARIDIGADEFRALGDFNADGRVDVVDMIQLILAWGTCPPGTSCIEDINQDGQIDVVDLIQMFLDWTT